MKKKLLTIFAVLALVVAMVTTVVACTKNPDPTPTPPGPPEPVKVDLSKLAKEGLGVLQTGLSNVLDTAMSKSDEKSYDLTLFAKVKVGDSVDADVKLHVAGTFGTKNKGLVDVVVGGDSYVTLYIEGNVVYIGEALTQEAMKWFKVDAVQASGIVDKFFPKLLDFFPIELGEEGKKQTIQQMIGGYLTIVKSVGAGIMATTVEDGIIKNELPDGRVQYINTLALSNIGSLLNDLKDMIDVRDLLSSPSLEPYSGLINTVCNVIFGGSLDALLDGEIEAENMPDIKLSFAAKNKNLTDFSVSYKHGIAFDEENPDDKTDISVEFGLENVNVTKSSNTAIATDAVTAGIKNAVEPAIKLTIAADVPGKEVGTTVEAYVVPKIGVSYHEHYSVPTTEYYTKQFYWDGEKGGTLNKHEMEKEGHECAKDKVCIHVDGWRRPVEADHKCAEGKVCVHDFDYETGKVVQGHKCAEGKVCKHYDEIDTTDFTDAKAFAIAKAANGNEIQLACDVDVTKLGSDGIVVLKVDLTGMWELMGVPTEDRADLPTTYQKTINFWGTEEAEEPDEMTEEEMDEYENTPPVVPADGDNKDDNKTDNKTEPTNLIDKVVALFSQKFEIGKVMALLTPGMDFVKGIYNDVLKDAIKTDETTNTATIDVAAILKGLVNDATIKGSDNLKINKEEHLTTYLTNLQGIANLVDNIMRHTDPDKKDVEKGKAYTKEELVALVKKYAGIDITDKAFENTSLVLTGIRGNATKDEGLGFTAELKSEGATVIKLTMKVDVIDAATVPEQKVIGNDFVGGELELIPDVDEDGNQKVDEKTGELLYKDGPALDNINALMKAILKAYEAKQKAAA